MYDERGQSFLFEITGNLYGLIRAGHTWWEYAKNWITNEMRFEQSNIHPCLFHIYWDEEFFCPIMNTTYPGGQEGHIVLYVDNIMSSFSVSGSIDESHGIKFWFQANFNN